MSRSGRRNRKKGKKWEKSDFLKNFFFRKIEMANFERES